MITESPETAPVMTPMPTAAATEPLLSVRDVSVHFPGPRRGLWGERTVLRAVQGVSFAIPRGGTLGLVGESGCGKSTLSRAILQLIRPSAGSVRFDGQELTALSDRALFPVRRRLQIVFQDPYASLDPRAPIGKTIGEGIRLHERISRAALRQRVSDLMARVGLNPALQNRYPHEFSGGQRQRVGIARALATAPTFLIGDEPISALDISIQAQILNLIGELRQEMNLTMLFVSHDLRAVRHISDRVAVMYLGRIVELADTDRLYAEPLHPYTQALLGSVPRPRWQRGPAAVGLAGEIPSPLQPPAGCPFSSRCPRVQPACHEQVPPLVAVVPGHQVACPRMGD